MQPPMGWHEETMVGTGARLTLWCCGPHLLHGLRWGVERGREPASTANDTLNPSRGSIEATFTTREGQRLGRFSIKLGRPAGLDIDAVVKHHWLDSFMQNLSCNTDKATGGLGLTPTMGRYTIQFVLRHANTLA